MAKELTTRVAWSPTTRGAGLFQKVVLNRLKKIRNGCIVLQDRHGVHPCGPDSSKKVVIQVLRERLYQRMALGGALGAAESYIDGDWECDDLSLLVEILAENQNALGSLEKGMAAFKKILSPLFHIMHRNNKQGARKNISAHYDLNDELFRRFLDPSMMYSSAFFPCKSTSLEEASLAKLERICRKLDLKAGDRVLETGTGWGGFAAYAAKNYDCHVTTTTVSQNQYRYVKELIQKEGLEDKIRLEKLDYRCLSGTFNKIVSVEMMEAVGAGYLDSYLQVCSGHLEENGAALIQVISINDQHYRRALKEVDFIKKYIFPGSFIPSLNAIVNSLAEKTDFRVYSVEDITPHYERTLREWQKNFNRNFHEIRQYGFDERFRRLWNYYFSYCIGGFAGRSVGSLQILLGKPGYRNDLSVRTTFRKGGQ